MGKRLFAEKKFDISGHVLEFDDFKMYRDQPQGEEIYNGYFEKIIKNGEEWLDYEIPTLLASDYAMYRKNGNRTVYQRKYNPRRRALLEVAIAEKVEGKGRFTEKLANLMWAIMEETSWCVPAHNRWPGNLPGTYQGVFDYIDLCVATTGANLALVYHICGDILDEYMPDIGERVRFELDRRIIKPFLNDLFMRDKCWWAGYNGNKVNNWNPWIVSNVLTVCALTSKELHEREAIVSKAMSLLDNFLAFYPEDGGCDEGPQYWAVGSRAFYNACELLYDMTGGYVNVYSDPLLKNMGEYVIKMIAAKDKFFAFSDCSVTAKINPMHIYHWGVVCDSDMMVSFAKNAIGGKLPDVRFDNSLCYQTYKYRTLPLIEYEDIVMPQKSWIPSIAVAVTREYAELDRGLCLSFKGGNNGESHNHNDVGSVIIFSDGKPVFIDMGCGEYTRRTFSEDRYDILSMRSEYHNCATVNGGNQLSGEEYCACDYEYNGETGSLKMNLKHAYPSELNIEKYTRYAELYNSVITIEDDIELLSSGSVAFNYITIENPHRVTDNSFVIGGRTVEFDPSLAYGIETVDASQEEMRKIPEILGVHELYRITLTSAEPVLKKKYKMTVR